MSLMANVHEVGRWRYVYDKCGGSAARKGTRTMVPGVACALMVQEWYTTKVQDIRARVVRVQTWFLKRVRLFF